MSVQTTKELLAKTHDFEANMIAAMPILYRLVTHYESDGNLDPL